MEQKLSSAIDYLRSRGKYILDNGNQFVRTTSTHTDIRQTFREFGTTVPPTHGKSCVLETQVEATCRTRGAAPVVPEIRGEEA
jgi:hypothetical protein